MPQMTPEQVKQWFKEHQDLILPTTEAVYQAFKSRLIEETTCCELPKEGR